MQFYDKKNEIWNNPHLLFSTKSELSTGHIIVADAKRWCIESTFHELKKLGQ